MKIAAYIFFSMLFFLIVQPLFHTMDKAVPTACSKVKCCKKAASNKTKKEPYKDCNPLMGCSSCNLFIIDKPVSYQPPVILIKEKNIIKNDNRIVRNLSECWHPPNTIA